MFSDMAFWNYLNDPTLTGDHESAALVAHYAAAGVDLSAYLEAGHLETASSPKNGGDQREDHIKSAGM